MPCSCWMSNGAGKHRKTTKSLVLFGPSLAHTHYFPHSIQTQVRTAKELEGLDGIVLPGGESTAMGLIGTGTGGGFNIWDALKAFSSEKPTWGTCAGMILLADKCVGASAVIENGQSLIGGLDVLVCRNYFGSQISSFEMATPPPPGDDTSSYPGVYIRAPAILTAGPGIQVLGKVVATPHSQAAVVLAELEKKIAAGEKVNMMSVPDALVRNGPGGIHFKDSRKTDSESEEKKDIAMDEECIELPGAADGSTAREVICACRSGHILCTAFHPELTSDYRWHAYFAAMVKESMKTSL